MVESGIRNTALTLSSEHKASTSSGYTMLLVLFVSLAAAVYGGTLLPRGAANGGAELGGLIIAAASLIFVFVLCGFYMQQPNQATAITLFGAYQGTDRNTGLRWLLPWLGRKKVSLRANNMISERLKVNDLRGNPIEIAAQVVWRVTDTAQALFDIDDYKAFVIVQIEAAVRTIGARYPYDDFEHQEVTLRGNHDQVAVELRAELIELLVTAGITVDECGFTPPCLMPPKLPARCCAVSKPRQWWPRAKRWSRARSAWSRWRSSCSARRTWSSWTTSAARRWCRT